MRIKFLRADCIRYKDRNKRFININQIMILKEIPKDPVLFLRGDQLNENGTNKSENFNLLENGYRSCISIGNAVYYSKKSLDVLLEVCDIEIVEQEKLRI